MDKQTTDPEIEAVGGEPLAGSGLEDERSEPERAPEPEEPAA